jgi:hypothetical protein
MKKLGYAIAALGMIVIAAPSIANAETIVIKRGGHHHFDRSHAEYRMHRDHFDRSRAEYRMHRDWHPHRDKVVVIKHRHSY